ncbi:MAG: outer membrane protein assembly factor BamC [Moraxellaceae bacterium]|nr:outer membrane protein assembly factor BamC [Moraxellaceae bacterium]
MKRECLLLAMTLIMSGCGLFPNRSLDYLQAKTLPPLDAQLATQREIQPLYVIPKVTTPTDKAAVLVQGKGRKQEFVVPTPQSILPKETPNNVVTQAVASKPEIVFDGNSVPLLHTAGNSLQVWEQLGLAMKAANLNVTDRNQSLGLYYLELVQDNKKQAYLLKLTQTSINNVVSVQKDSDTLADSKLSQQIFLNIIKHWPS